MLWSKESCIYHRFNALKGAIHSQLKLSDFTVWRRTWRKKLSKLHSFNWQWGRPQNCPFQSSFTQRTAQFTQRVPQFPQSTCRHHDGIISRNTSTSVSSNSFSRWASHDIFLYKYHFLFHILRFLFFFSDNVMADVANKQQTTALFLSTVVTCTRRHTELTNLMGNLCCAREYSVQFFVQFFYTV
jgi:hypothetical protein